MAVLEQEKVLVSPNQCEIHKYQVRIPHLSHTDYRAWLFGLPHSINKDKLLELTLFPFPPEERTLTYYKSFIDEGQYKSLIYKDLKQFGDLTFSDHWYDFRHEGHFFVDFAHPTSFGGGFRSWGNLQEETLFCEFPKLAHFAWATEQNPITCSTPFGQPTPFIVPFVKRYTIISELYGAALERARVEEINTKVFYLDPLTEKTVHILGMAAICWKDKDARYQLKDLEYLFKMAFAAFEGAKMIESKPVIHTGNWGCGAFRNSEKMIAALQLLAANLAEIEIVFDGVADEILNEACTQVKSCKNIHAAFQQLLQTQQDPTWRPKN